MKKRAPPIASEKIKAGNARKITVGDAEIMIGGAALGVE